MSIIPQFYFLTDDYFADFPDQYLMQNKPSVNGKQHGRPCFFAFRDKDNPKIFWVVPVSSNVAKYRAEAQKEQKRYGHCNTICIGKLLGRDTAFLIQNMCPVTSGYMIPYKLRNGNPVTIRRKLALEIKKKASITLNLVRNGINAVYPDIMKIYAALDAETN